MSLTRSILGAAAIMAALALFAGPSQAQPVVIDVRTNHGGDTIYLGNPAELVFSVDAGSHLAKAVLLCYRYAFTGGVQAHALVEGSTLHWSPYSDTAFGFLFANSFYAAKNPQDSVFLCGEAFSAGGPGWTGQHEFARIQLDVTDTGTIYLDSIMVPPANRTSVLDPSAQELPIDWRPGPIVVVPCPWMVGDLNGSSTITLADVILLVNYVFKSGAEPQPHVKMGDANCSNTVTSADVIHLVNFQGKGGPAPCPCFIP